MKIRFIKGAFYVSSICLLFFMAACIGRSDKQQGEGKVPQTPMPVMTEITITPHKQAGGISPTARRIFTPTILPTFTAEPFQLYKHFPDGEYLIIGILKQFALSLDGKQKLPLPDDITFDSARVFPDGSKIAVVASDADSLTVSLRFRIIDPVTGQQTDIPRVEGCISADSPGLSPDGTMLIFSCGDRIVMQSIPDGKETGQMVIEDSTEPDTFSISSPVWSLDGKWIAYRWSAGGIDPERPMDQVIVLSADCFNQPETCLENAKKFSFQGRTDYNLFDWGADNRLVILDLEAVEIRVYDVVSMKLVQRIPLSSPFVVENMAISPDGNQIAFGQQTADKKEAAIYVASIEDGEMKKIFAERYRVDLDFVNIWIKIR